MSFAVVEWIDVFTRNEYKNIFLESLEFCQHNKGMEIFAWCIMTNHVHLVFRSVGNERPEDLLGDLKRFTSRKLTNAIEENQQESRRAWMLRQFAQAAAATSNTTKYQFWRHDNKPIELWSNKVIAEKINYIHLNPVEEGQVQYPQEYLYSSARDHAGEKGCLKDVIVVQI